VILETVVDQLQSLDEDATILARRPWSASSEAKVSSAGDVSRADAKKSGFEYFLEVHVAREVLEVFGPRKANRDEKLRLLLHYAEHDAYPEWVYD
jgi:hypothetical protein